MTSVPRNPDAFFDAYVPETFARIADQLVGKTSEGAIVFRVGELVPFALSLVSGKVAVTRDLPESALVQVSLSADDFAPILVHGAEVLETSSAARDRQLAVFRALLVDAERARAIRAVEGSLALELSGETPHRLILTPGIRTPNSAAECTVRCSLSDFWSLQRGDANPFELMMNGKIQISGDAQIAMALSSLFI